MAAGALGATHRAQNDVDAMLKEMASAKIFGKADKWGTFTERVQWVVNTIFEAIAETIVGVASAVLWLLLKSYEIIQFLLIGLILLAINAIVIWLVTTLAPTITTLTDIVDHILEFLQEGVNLAIGGFLDLIGFVNHDIIDNLNKIPGVHIHDIDIPLKKWTGNPGVDPTLVHQWCVSLAPTCKRFDGALKILAYLVRLGAHTGVCKMVRVTYPVEDTYHTNVMPTVWGWMYYGGAAPFPHQPNENCIGREPTPNSGIDGNVQKSLDYTCILLGVCYLFLEIYLALVLIRAILIPLWGAIKKCFELVFYFAEMAVRDALEMAAVTVKTFLLV